MTTIELRQEWRVTITGLPEHLKIAPYTCDSESVAQEFAASARRHLGDVQIVIMWRWVTQWSDSPVPVPYTECGYPGARGSYRCVLPAGHLEMHASLVEGGLRWRWQTGVHGPENAEQEHVHP